MILELTLLALAWMALTGDWSLPALVFSGVNGVVAVGEEFDQYIDECRSAVEIEEVQQAAANAMKVLIDDQFVVIPLAGVFRIYGVSANVEGFEPHPSGLNQRWNSVSLKG